VLLKTGGSEVMPLAERRAVMSSAHELWTVPIRMPVVPREEGDSDPIGNRFAHEDIVTFVRALSNDIVTIEAMFRRCSVQTLQRRFFRPLPSAPQGYIEEVLADRDSHHAFAVQHKEKTIGLAELHLEGPWTGALALIIEDPYQRKGIGTTALQLLECRARELGIRMLTADVLFENSPVLRALRRVGPASISRADDIFHVEIDLGPGALVDDLEVGSRLCAG
jgi:RimJ/RimL family protein N-acetyltransferase